MCCFAPWRWQPTAYHQCHQHKRSRRPRNMNKQIPYGAYIPDEFGVLYQVLRTMSSPPFVVWCTIQMKQCNVPIRSWPQNSWVKWQSHLLLKCDGNHFSAIFQVTLHNASIPYQHLEGLRPAFGDFFYISVMWPKRSIIGNHLVHIPLMCAVSFMLTWGVEVMNLAWFNNQTILIWIDSPQTCRFWKRIINWELFCQTFTWPLKSMFTFLLVVFWNIRHCIFQCYIYGV